MAALLGGIKGGAALKKVDDSEKRDASTARSAGAVVGANTEKKPEPVSSGVTPASARANISKALGGNKFGGGAPAPAPAPASNRAGSKWGGGNNNSGGGGVVSSGGGGGGGFRDKLESNANGGGGGGGGSGPLTEARLKGLETRMASIEAKLDRLLEIAGVPV